MAKNPRKKSMMTKPYYDRYWRLRLSNLASNMFKYKNLPDEYNKNISDMCIGFYDL